MFHGEGVLVRRRRTQGKRGDLIFLFLPAQSTSGQTAMSGDEVSCSGREMGTGKSGKLDARFPAFGASRHRNGGGVCSGYNSRNRCSS